LWDAVRHHKILVAGITLLGLVLGGVAAFALPNTRTATTTVLLNPLVGNPYAPGTERDPLVALATEAALVRSDDVTAAVIEDLGLSDTVPALQSQVRTSVPSNTQVLEVEFADAEEDRARDIAQAYADQYLAFRVAKAEEYREERLAVFDEQIGDTRAALASLAAGPSNPVTATLQEATAQDLRNLQTQQRSLQSADLDPGQVIVPARVPAGQVTALALLLPLAGGVLGLLAGVGAALLREQGRGRLRRIEQLDELGLPVLAVVPGSTREQAPTHDQRLAVLGTATAVRRLEPVPDALAVTVVGPGAAAGLARHLAEALGALGTPAVFVDATGAVPQRSDRSQPWAMPLVGVGRDLGRELAEATDERSVRAAYNRFAADLALAPAGMVHRYAPQDATGTPASAPVGSSDVAPSTVVLATPPSDQAETHGLVAAAHDVVLVARLDVTPLQAVTDAVAVARQVGADVLGVLVVDSDVPDSIVSTRRPEPTAAAMAASGSSAAPAAGASPAKPDPAQASAATGR
jgi:capsular polysaccharide biosynthesis protein